MSRKGSCFLGNDLIAFSSDYFLGTKPYIFWDKWLDCFLPTESGKNTSSVHTSFNLTVNDAVTSKQLPWNFIANFTLQQHCTEVQKILRMIWNLVVSSLQEPIQHCIIHICAFQWQPCCLYFPLLTSAVGLGLPLCDYGYSHGDIPQESGVTLGGEEAGNHKCDFLCEILLTKFGYIACPHHISWPHLCSHCLSAAVSAPWSAHIYLL